MAEGVNLKHGMWNKPEYRAWENARSRCTREKDRKFPIYGGRGIRMCEAWSKSFTAFFADMGLKPSPQHTLERIDSNGHYEPMNCKWALRTEQNRNRPSYNRMVEFDGKMICVAEAAERTGIPHGTILSRLNRGWNDDKACS